MSVYLSDRVVPFVWLSFFAYIRLPSVPLVCIAFSPTCFSLLSISLFSLPVLSFCCASLSFRSSVFLLSFLSSLFPCPLLEVWGMG